MPREESAVKKAIPVAELRFGMYVAELDRPWTETPFVFQGFILRTEEELASLSKLCSIVYVDPDRAEAAEPPPAPVQPARNTPIEEEFAKAGSIYVLRQTATGTQRLDANYKNALKGKVQPMVLQPGDTVVVP